MDYLGVVDPPEVARECPAGWTEMAVVPVDSRAFPEAPEVVRKWRVLAGQETPASELPQRPVVLGLIQEGVEITMNPPVVVAASKT